MFDDPTDIPIGGATAALSRGDHSLSGGDHSLSGGDHSPYQHREPPK